MPTATQLPALDAAADRLAAELQRRGVRGETPVPILLRRGPDYVVAMLAVLKAGGLIVPLDPAMPAERIARSCARPARRSSSTMRCSTAVAGEAATRITAPRRVRPARAPTSCSPRAPPENPRASSAPTRPCWPTAPTTCATCWPRRRRGAAARCASRTPGRSPSTRRGNRWSRCSTGIGVHIIGDDVQRDAEALVATIDRVRRRHDRHHAVDVHPAARRGSAVHGAAGGAGPRRRGHRHRCVAGHPRRMRAHRDARAQLLRAHRDHRRGRRRRDRRERAARASASRPGR